MWGVSVRVLLKKTTEEQRPALNECGSLPQFGDPDGVKRKTGRRAPTAFTLSLLTLML